jgi:hypothetical protein
MLLIRTERPPELFALFESLFLRKASFHRKRRASSVPFAGDGPKQRGRRGWPSGRGTRRF